MKMKKTAVVFAAALSAGVCVARPHGGFGGHRPPPPRMHHGWAHAPHHRSYWGAGGRHFWPGFVGGVVGAAVVNTIVDSSPVVVASPTVVVPSPTVVAPAPTVVVPAPTVVQQPVVTTPVTQTRSVWVEGRYVDQVQADGSVVRVWEPGHYEQQQVIVR